jgi:hypothetical protein
LSVIYLYKRVSSDCIPLKIKIKQIFIITYKYISHTTKKILVVLHQNLPPYTVAFRTVQFDCTSLTKLETHNLLNAIDYYFLFNWFKINKQLNRL